MVSRSIRPLIRASGIIRSAGGSTGRASGTSGPRSRSSTRRPQAEAVEITQTNASDTTAETGQRIRSRTRRKKLNLDSSEVPSLKEFVHRQTVMRQYRGFLRAVACIPDPAFQSSSKREVQTSFGRYKNETDALTIQMTLREGERQLEQVRSMVGYVRPDNAPKKDEDSWLNIDDEEDPRGRVGVVWPWEQKK